MRSTTPSATQVLLLLFGTVAGPATAASFSATADVVNSAGNPRASQTRGGAAPVTATAGPVSSTDGLRTGQATASALRGALQVVGLSASTSGKVTSIGQAGASFDDVLFVFRTPGPATGVLPSATLNFSLSAAQSLSGPALGLPGFNTRDVTFSVSFAGASTGGTLNFERGSGLGQLGSQQLSATNVPVGTPVRIDMSLVAGAAATPGSPQLVQSAITAVLQVGAAQAGGPAAPQRLGRAAALSAASTESTESTESTTSPASARSADPGLAGGVLEADLPPLVFDLPDDVTVFSPSMGIVDNRWVAQAVPEPATWALWLAGAAPLAGPMRRRNRAGAQPGHRA